MSIIFGVYGNLFSSFKEVDMTSDFDKELQFTKKLLHSFRLDIRYISAHPIPSATSSTGLSIRSILGNPWEPQRLLELLGERCQPNVIYHVCDFVACNYILFQMPLNDRLPVYAYIGPYLSAPVSKQDIYVIMERYRILPELHPQVEQFYQDAPLIPDENMLFSIIYTLGEKIWGSLDAFSAQKIREDLAPETYTTITDYDALPTEEALLGMQLLEERYALEARLMQAVSSGQNHRAELALAGITRRQFEQRSPNSLRNLKNYLIILNTLLRIAAGNASVHPFHIDQISSQFAHRIEIQTSEAACNTLIREMVRKYCLLVKNHSLKGYSLLIQKVVTRIEYDLTADLSLKTQAELLNINPSYLSTLFKRETGSTLTDYVNRKRIEHALFLLNSTNMQIQVIAQYCGIPDVNYFTKLFKKQIGKTPKEYREGIAPIL